MNGLSRLFLGYVFLSAGFLKVFVDTPLLVREWGAWVSDQPSFGVRVLGMVETMAGLLLVVPLVFEAPGDLVNIGAFMVILIMTGAMYENVKIGRSGTALMNVAMAGVGGVVIFTQHAG